MLSAARAYSNIAFSGAICIVMLNILANAVRGTGNMTVPGVVIMSSVIAHILISPSLIFGWGPIPAFGPAGAALGLMAPFGVGSLALIAYLRSSRAIVTLNFRGVRLQWGLFAEILKVGLPGLINAGITNFSVALLTGIASHLGREVAIGYAMGARLEYILIPLGFGFGAAISAMVGTNWGAKQYRRACAIGWTEQLPLRLPVPPSEWWSHSFQGCGWACLATTNISFGSAPVICRSWGRFTAFMVWGWHCFLSPRELEAMFGR